MADTGDDLVSLGTRIGACIPPAPRIESGSISSSASGAAGSRHASYASAAGARQDRSTQAQALGQSKSQVSGPSGCEEAKSEDASIANSTIKSGGTIPLAPPFATINVAASVQGTARGGGLGPSHVATGGKTREEMLFSAAQDTPD